MKHATVFGEIPINWAVKRIIDIKSDDKRSIAMGPFGSNIKAENFVSDGVPVIRGTNMNYSRFVDGKFVFLTEKKADELISSNCKPDDIVFTHRGTIGQVALIPHNKYKRYVVSQSGMKLTVNKKIIKPMFLFYFFKSEYGQYQILKYEAQVGVPSISNPLTSLKEMEIPVPSIAEQKAIASVLSSLDDKIDLLHRQNKTLESMAETLFRQWFIESPQKYWTEKPLSEIATFTNGLACQNFPVNAGELGLPVLKIKELNTGITDSSDIASSNVKPEYIVHHGDIIFSWSASLMVKIWSGPNCVLNQHLFNVKSDKYPKWFYYEWCKYHLKEFISISQSHATTMGHIKRKDLDEAKVIIPSDEEMKKMNIEMDLILSQHIEKLKQIQTLEKLRDTLLPKLMSGEVRVKYTK